MIGGVEHNQFNLSNRELALQKASSLQIFPYTTDLLGNSLNLVQDLLSFDKEISDFEEQSLLKVQRVVGIFGLPDSGKDWLMDNVIIPYLGKARRNAFDEKAAFLRLGRRPVIATPKGVPLQSFELVATRIKTIADTVSDVKREYRKIVMQGPAGTSLQYGLDNSMFFSTREYMDQVMYDFLIF
ncbi:MAG TPA: hypothetical protein VG895_03485 [Patescibacteria group bacterium]|nr:hypothetical protein [Patescibacteria group bacterium]